MYYYWRFGQFFFQQGQPADDVSSPQVMPSVVSVPDGYYYYRGVGPVPFLPQRVSFRRIIAGDYQRSCEENWANAQRDLQALVGTRSRLFRKWYDNPNQYEFINAVFEGFSAVRGTEVPNTLAVDLKFQLLEPRWHGLPYGTYNDGTDYQFDESRITLQAFPGGADIFLVNPGNVEVPDLRIDCLNNPGSGITYTNLQFLNTTKLGDHHGFSWTGPFNPPTIVPHHFIFKNREASVSASDDGGPAVGVWSGVTLLGTARPDRMLILYPGTNTIHVSASATGLGTPSLITIEFSYYGAHG